MSISTGAPTASEIVDAAFLADAAYSSSSSALDTALAKGGWTPVTAADLGMTGPIYGPMIDGDSSGALYNVTSSMGFIARKGNTLAIVFCRHQGI